jgi:hypothetical protein
VNGGTALGISGNTLVGTYSVGSNQVHGYIYSGGTFATVDDPEGDGSLTVVTGVSGSTTVGFYNGNDNQYGFIDDGSTFTTLSDPFAQPVGVGGTETEALGIAGQTIVGFYLVECFNLMHSYSTPRAPGGLFR